MSHKFLLDDSAPTETPRERRARKARAMHEACQSTIKAGDLPPVNVPMVRPSASGDTFLVSLESNMLDALDAAIAKAVPITEKAAPRASQTSREAKRQRARRYANEHAHGLDKIRAMPSRKRRKIRATLAKHGV